MPDTDPEKPFPAKRTRVGTACHECRRKKVRCDGDTPQCGNCRQRKIVCEFPNKFVRANASQDYVKFLETRLGILDANEKQKGLPNSFPVMHTEVSPKPQPTLEQVADLGPGTSSVLSFMSLVEAAAGKPKIETSPKPYDDSPFTKKRAIHPQSHALPSKEVGELLLEKFLEQVYPLYPIIHKPTFMEDFSALWMGNSSDITYALINMAFAVGAIISGRVDAEVYFNRARVYMDSSIMRWTFSEGEGIGLDLLQTLLLACLYLLLTQQVTPCRNMLGLLNRICQDARRQLEQDNLKKDIFSRVWYGCFIIDRLVATIFGKPLLIVSDKSIQRPIFMEEDSVNAPGSHIQNGNDCCQDITVADLFTQNILISEITTDVLKMLYNNEGTGATTLGVSRNNVLKTILDLEIRMATFQNQIPEHLKFEIITQHPPQSCAYIQSFILHVRILHLKIMLYRPVLLPQDDGMNSESPIFSSLNLTISRTCVQSAVDVINLVWDKGDICGISAYWYTMFYIYNAAVVVLAALLKGHSKNIDVDVLVLDTAWSRALALIPAYEKHSVTARQCLHTLLDAHDRVLSPDKLLDFFFESLI